MIKPVTTPRADDCTKLFTMEGVTFYEDPTYGDESTMWAEYRGLMYATDWWDRPDPSEVQEWIKQITGGYEHSDHDNEG